MTSHIEAWLLKRSIDRNYVFLNILRFNVFPRVRGNTLHSSVPEPDSVRTQYIQTETETLHTTSRIKTPLRPREDATCLPFGELRDKIAGNIWFTIHCNLV